MNLRLLLLPVLALGLLACNGKKPDTTAGTTGSTPTPKQGTDGGPKLKELGKQDIKVGKGTVAALKTVPTVEPGDIVAILYTGKLANGKQFDSNDTAGSQPLAFQVGVGAMVPGMEMGVVGMKPGGERKISIPSALGYGAQSTGDIPPNSDLYFTVKLLDVVKQHEQNVFDKWDKKVGSGRAAKKGDVVRVHVKAYYSNGTEFLNTSGGKPEEATLGEGEFMVLAFDKAIPGMKVGGTRTLRVPPALGLAPSETIGSMQVQYFDISLVGIK